MYDAGTKEPTGNGNEVRKLRIKLSRKERDRFITIGTGVVYIKDGNVWRETTRAEMEILDIQSGMSTDNPPMTISVDLPKPDMGSDGDYYALLYPLGQDGELWDGEVWSGN